MVDGSPLNSVRNIFLPKLSAKTSIVQHVQLISIAGMFA